MSDFNVNLEAFAIESTSAVLQWSGTNVSWRPLQLLYRRLPSQPHQRVTTLFPGTQRSSYQLQGLQPGTSYEACLAFLGSADHQTGSHLSCARFTTGKMARRVGPSGASKRDRLMVSLALGLVATLLIALALVVVSLKRTAAGHRDLETSGDWACYDVTSESKESLLPQQRSDSLSLTIEEEEPFVRVVDS